jgi:hypothetical protein
VVHGYYEFALRCRKLRIVEKGALGLGMIVVHVYDEFLLQGMKLKGV